MIVALLAVAFLAGLVDAIAGGGGLLTVPALLATGLPPHLALGTNKAQAVWGSGASLLGYVRARMVDRKRAPAAFVAGFAGSLGGAALVLLLAPEVLRPIVLVLLVAVAAFLAFRPPLHPAPALVTPRWEVPVGLALAATFGAYDGFFGPGTGTFLILGFVLLLGHGLTRASAEAKVVNFASNLAAFLLFAAQGMVDWAIALPMAGAQLVGGYAGSQLAVRGGDRLVRWVVLCVVVALVLKLAHDAAA
jgi:uncharacterized membrane protein YfcA